MNLKTIFDWSEAWAPLVPLAVLIRHRRQPAYVRPVILYLVLSFIFNLAADIIWKQSSLGLSLFTVNNNPVYNIHSIVRFFLFAFFFIQLHQRFAVTVKRVLPFAFLAFVIIDLIFWEYFLAQRIAHQIHAAEAGLLLVYCLLFYFFLLRTEAEISIRTPAFWITTGLIIFVAVCFPIYLYYESALKNYRGFTINIWSVQKIAFLALCFAIAIAFSLTDEKKVQYE